MPTFTIIPTGEALDVDASWTIEQFYQAMLSKMSGSIDSSNLITGRIGGAIPTTDIGVWLDGLIWKAWYPTRTVANGVTNSTKTITSATINFAVSDIGKTVTGTDIPVATVIEYVDNATTARISNTATGTHTGNTVTINPGSSGSYHSAIPNIYSNGLYIALVASLSGNRTISFQDKSGTVALTDDVYIPRATIFPTLETSPTETVIDWSLSSSFGLTLDKDIVLRMDNSVSGQEIDIVAYNGLADSWTIDWAGTNVSWAGGTAPTMSVTGAADKYHIINVGSQLYGSALQDFS